MTRSMTGFGKGREKTDCGYVLVEIKTVNHKYFELSAKLPSCLSMSEGEIRDRLQQEIIRGRVNLFIDIEIGYAKKGNVIINEKLALSYKNKLNRLRHILKDKEEVDLYHVMALPGVVSLQEEPMNFSKISLGMKKALKQALSGVVATRIKEGQALEKDVLKRIANLTANLKKIRARVPDVIRLYRDRQLKAFEDPKKISILDSERIDKEVALFSKNSDVSEEICRIQAHLESFLATMKKGGEIGKRLDFTAQEIHREVTTVGSKANDFIIAQEVIKMKSEVEKVREQLQNIE